MATVESFNRRKQRIAGELAQRYPEKLEVCPRCNGTGERAGPVLNLVFLKLHGPVKDCGGCLGVGMRSKPAQVGTDEAEKAQERSAKQATG